MSEISRILKIIKRLVSTRNAPQRPVSETELAPDQRPVEQATPLSRDLDVNLSSVRDSLGNPSDLVVRRFNIGGAEGRPSAIVFLDGFVDIVRVGDQILRPITERVDAADVSRLNPDQLLQHLKRDIIPIPGIEHREVLEKVLSEVLNGCTALLCDGANTAVLMATRDFEHREVEEPTLETVIRGPKEGFTENLQININLVRRKIAHPQVRFEEMTIGRYSQTRVVVAYVTGLAEDGLVQEVQDRLFRVDIDGVIESGYLEQLIEDAPYSLFPTIGNTEKPDTVAARLLEGKVAVLVDGTPMALTMPRLFSETIQSPEDYYSRPYSASVARVLRYALLIITTVLPGFYLAVVNYHPEVLPPPFIVTVAAAQEGVPLLLFLELLLMGAFFEGLREAGVRLPRPVGSAMTIVGALIIGEAAVAAGIIGAPSVVVTALVGIAGFATPGLADAFPVVRVFLLVLASMSGLFGLVLGALMVFTHLCSLRSFGAPYMIPVAPMQFTAWKDIFIRAPLWVLDERPGFFTRRNRTRMRPASRPGPPARKTWTKRTKRIKE